MTLIRRKNKLYNDSKIVDISLGTLKSPGN